MACFRYAFFRSVSEPDEHTRSAESDRANTPVTSMPTPSCSAREMMIMGEHEQEWGHGKYQVVIFSFNRRHRAERLNYCR